MFYNPSSSCICMYDIHDFMWLSCYFWCSSTAASCVIADVTEKLADAKTGTAAADALTVLSEATKLDSVSAQVLEYGFTQKNPKVQVELLNWLSNAIVEFGFV